jgi:hypothetical protein
MRIFEKTFDPDSGITTTIGAEDGKMVVKKEGDVAPSLDLTSTLRNDADYSKNGIKKDWWHVAHIPEVAVLKILTEDGFNVLTEHPKEVMKFLNRNKHKYGYLFTTTGKV